jgi:predicted solute-binding protein
MAHARQVTVQKIDLGEVWTAMTGLPFVWAFWAGRPDRLTAGDLQALRQARDAGVTASEPIARQYLADRPERQAAGARYLRDNIKYYLGPDERAGLELFYRYAADAGVVDSVEPLRFY